LRMVEVVMEKDDAPPGPLTLLMEAERKRMENLGQ
jgi:hypothetical protein